METRKAYFAGSWYPKNAGACEKEIESFLRDAQGAPSGGKGRVAGIVPHAGWFYSGAIACRVIRCLQGEKPPDVAVIFGTHLHRSSPGSIMAEGAWETPFGPLEVHGELAGELARRFSLEKESPRRANPDNTIEVQLPLVKYLLGETRIVPISTPPVEKSLEMGKAVVEISRRLGLGIRVIGSTDLTHYGPNYDFSPHGAGPGAVAWVKEENDRRMVEAMTGMDAGRVIREGIKNQNACCPGAAAAAISAARELGAERGELLVYATSHDKGPSESFVGYAGIVY